MSELDTSWWSADPSFGEVERVTNPRGRFLRVRLRLDSLPQFHQAQEALRQRSRLRSSHLMPIVDFSGDEAVKELSILVEDPGASDFGPSLAIKEKLAAFRGCLETLSLFESVKRAHGNIRPGLVHFSKGKKRIVLVDRLGDSLSGPQRQTRNLEEGKPIYLPFKAAERLRAGRTDLCFSPYKSDLFALGLVFAEAMCPELRVQRLVGDAAATTLRAALEGAAEKSRDEESRLFLEFLKDVVLRGEEEEAPGPREAITFFAKVPQFEEIWREFCLGEADPQKFDPPSETFCLSRVLAETSEAGLNPPDASMNQAAYFRSLGIEPDESMAVREGHSLPPSAIFPKITLQPPQNDRGEPADLEATLTERIKTLESANAQRGRIDDKFFNILDDFILITEPEPSASQPSVSESSRKDRLSLQQFQILQVRHKSASRNPGGANLAVQVPRKDSIHPSTNQFSYNPSYRNNFDQTDSTQPSTTQVPYDPKVLQSAFSRALGRAQRASVTKAPAPKSPTPSKPSSMNLDSFLEAQTPRTPFTRPVEPAPFPRDERTSNVSLNSSTPSSFRAVTFEDASFSAPRPRWPARENPRARTPTLGPRTEPPTLVREYHLVRNSPLPFQPPSADKRFVEIPQAVFKPAEPTFPTFSPWGQALFSGGGAPAVLQPHPSLFYATKSLGSLPGFVNQY